MMMDRYLILRVISAEKRLGEQWWHSMGANGREFATEIDILLSMLPAAQPEDEWQALLEAAPRRINPNI